MNNMSLIEINSKGIINELCCFTQLYGSLSVHIFGFTACNFNFIPFIHCFWMSQAAAFSRKALIHSQAVSVYFLLYLQYFYILFCFVFLLYTLKSFLKCWGVLLWPCCIHFASISARFDSDNVNRSTNWRSILLQERQHETSISVLKMISDQQTCTQACFYIKQSSNHLTHS